MKKFVPIIIMLLTAATFAADLPHIAVYVTGDFPDNEKQALGTQMLSALINSGRYRGIERSAAFLAEIEKEHVTQRSGAIDDDQISELGRQYGVKFICIADITPALGDYHVSARIINVETAEVVFIGVSTSPLKTLDDLTQASDQVITDMFDGQVQLRQQPLIAHRPQPVPPPVPVPQPTAATPPPQTTAPAQSRSPTVTVTAQLPQQQQYKASKVSMGISAGYSGDYGGGVNWPQAKEQMIMSYNGQVVDIYLDFTYVEFFYGMSIGGEKWKTNNNAVNSNDLTDTSRGYVNFGALIKIPLVRSESNSTGFSLITGIDFNLDVDTEREQVGGDLSAPWFKFGCELDIGIGEKYYMRFQSLYGFRTANDFEKNIVSNSPFPAETRTGHGLTAKLGIGRRFGAR